MFTWFLFSGYYKLYGIKFYCFHNIEKLANFRPHENSIYIEMFDDSVLVSFAHS
ncbi:hypothetical protein PAHAL_6G166400 [Panicum hallii]|uniref:Uncharacterized protein n=1 Tax=Panicum hallii TaxID=206008 RepID=A0A2T8IGG1_9POAL|nr:hypothetical protein PAHAL_6G166400 [Panicum hallii]